MPSHYGSGNRLKDPEEMKGFMSQEQLDNAQFEAELRRNEMEDMAEQLMSENPKMAQKVQAELKRRFQLDPRRMNQSLAKVQTPQGRAALTMFG
tara:strand:+ start:908 stop:1189 length:282 start_codon:yes stop_codon:yes gene_type:complete